MRFTKLRVRPAEPTDLEGIVATERKVWEEGVGVGSAASPELIEWRIELCNTRSELGWFWIAESRSEGIVGTFVLQPTSMKPGECLGWDHATDCGQLTGTFDAGGKYVYGVSLSVPSGAPIITAQLLVHTSIKLRLATGKHIIFACARMPSFRAVSEERGVTPQAYCLERRKDGSPKDPFLWHFEAMTGMKPVRLLEDGYPPDLESCGHGVLVQSDNLVRDWANSEVRLLGEVQK